MAWSRTVAGPELAVGLPRSSGRSWHPLAARSRNSSTCPFPRHSSRTLYTMLQLSCPVLMLCAYNIPFVRPRNLTLSDDRSYPPNQRRHQGRDSPVSRPAPSP